MSEVRERLCNLMAATNGTNGDLADAILERFEVTPKPVVGYLDIGILVQEAIKLAREMGTSGLGREMMGVLEAAGLKIVRIEERAR